MLHLRMLVPVLLLASTAMAAAATPLSLKLQSQVTARWEGQKLRTVLERIAETQGIVAWVDRRVNPQYIVNAQFTAVDLSQVLDQILNDAELGWSAWDGIIYVGPRESAREATTLLAIARQSLGGITAPRREAWLAPEPVGWPRLSEPRALLIGWLDQAGAKLKNPQDLSHDLWEARQLPSLPLVDRVVLLLLGFDKTFSLSNGGEILEIVPIRRPVLVTEEYQPGRKMRDLLSAFHDESGVVVKRQGHLLKITGRWEHQQRARQIIEGAIGGGNGAQALSPHGDERRFSMKLENQRADRVIDQLADQLGLTVAWSDDATSKRKSLTSCDVRDGTLEDLLAAVLKPVELGFTLEGTQLTILSND